MISLPLKSHRVRFKTYPFTFTTEEALQNMASLRLTQTNRMDDPKVEPAFDMRFLTVERWSNRHYYNFDFIFDRTGDGPDNWRPVCTGPISGSRC